MGTRALVRVIDRNEEILCLYRQFDGYPDGLGQELADFATPLTIGNGIPVDATDFANGMGCFAAQLVAHLKDKAGNVYVYAPGTKDVGEEIYVHPASGRRKGCHGGKRGAGDVFRRGIRTRHR